MIPALADIRQSQGASGNTAATIQIRDDPALGGYGLVMHTGPAANADGITSISTANDFYLAQSWSSKGVWKTFDILLDVANKRYLIFIDGVRLSANVPTTPKPVEAGDPPQQFANFDEFPFRQNITRLGSFRFFMEGQPYLLAGEPSPYYGGTDGGTFWLSDLKISYDE